MNDKFLSTNQKIKDAPPPTPDTPKHYRVRVSSGLTPTMIYMNVFDKKSVHYEEFQNKLQEEVRKNAEQETDIQEGIAVFLLIIYLFTY